MIVCIFESYKLNREEYIHQLYREMTQLAQKIVITLFD
jgi:hypothetical protein